MRFETGQTVGGYEFLKALGTAPSGVTYKVRNVMADRLEILKVLPRELQEDQEKVERFLREAKVHSRLAHPHIASFYSAMPMGGELVMTSEWVEGMRLSERLKDGPIERDDALRWIAQVLDALAYAHREGIIHRSIASDNLIVTPANTVKLTGFGHARLTTGANITQPGVVAGRVHYISPEQVKGARDLDARSDIYSLGVVLYEAVTGKRPFESKSQFEIFLAHVQSAPAPPIEVRPDVPLGLSDSILKALEKEPSRRYSSAEEFRTALAALSGGAAATEGPAEAPPPPVDFVEPAAGRPAPPDTLRGDVAPETGTEDSTLLIWSVFVLAVGLAAFVTLLTLGS